jgi:hypothetical protein
LPPLIGGLQSVLLDSLAIKSPHEKSRFVCTALAL